MPLTITDSEIAWNTIVQYFNNTNNFESTTGKKYIGRIENNRIFYSGVDRNGGFEETISSEEFEIAFDSIMDLPKINTSRIADIISSSLYMKRSPFIGLLISAGILTNQ